MSHEQLLKSVRRNNMPIQNEYVTIEELMQYLKVGRSTINRWRKEGMPFVKIGRGVRFVLEDVNRWIDSNKKN